MIRLALSCLALVLTAQGVAAQSPALNKLQAAPFFISHSGQFHVRLQQEPEIREPMRDGEIFLEPNFVAVSAERVKSALLHELRIPDRAQGKIHLAVSPSKSSREIIPVIATSFNDGWHFRVELPQRIGEVAFVRAITHALLTELANRDGAARSAQIPLWLSEGLSQKILYEVGPGFLLKHHTYVDLERVRFKPAFFFRELKPDLKLKSFSELAELRIAEGMDADAVQSSIASALLFANELLLLQDGPASLTRMIQLLPHRWNWQTALIEAFPKHFRTLLDVEKWWSVAIADLSGQSARLTGITESAFRPLDLVLQAAILERASTNSLPEESTITLQEFIRRTGFAEQREPIKQKVAQLLHMQFKASPAVAAMAEGYRAALEQYFVARDSGAPTGSLRLPPAAVERAAVERVVRELDKLDQERANLKDQLATQSTAYADPRVRDPRRQR